VNLDSSADWTGTCCLLDYYSSIIVMISVSIIVMISVSIIVMISVTCSPVHLDSSADWTGTRVWALLSS
jgi:hypothetical protein